MNLSIMSAFHHSSLSALYTNLTVPGGLPWTLQSASRNTVEENGATLYKEWVSLYLLGQPWSRASSVAAAGPFVNRVSTSVISRRSGVASSTLPALPSDLHKQLSLFTAGLDVQHLCSKPGALNSLWGYQACGAFLGGVSQTLKPYPLFSPNGRYNLMLLLPPIGNLPQEMTSSGRA